MSGAHVHDGFADALQTIAESVTDVVGFEVAAISIATEQHLQMVAIAGDEAARESLVGHRTPVAEIEKELASGEDWGAFVFVPHERMSLEIDRLGWVPDLEPTDDPTMWHPLDLLLAPVYDDEGRLRGLLSVDMPEDRRRPDLQKRAELERFAQRTRRSILTAVERERLAEQIRLAEAARGIVRQVSSELSLERVLEVAQPALVQGFRATGLWIQTFDEDGQGSGAIHAPEGVELEMPEDLVAIARYAAEDLWQRQEAVVISEALPVPGVLHEGQSRLIIDFLASIDIRSILFVPLGAGRDCLGNLVFTRTTADVDWTPQEIAAAVDIGNDLGRALLNARTFERERQLVEELRALNGYKSNLIDTISHELKNPLTSIVGHLEILESVPDLPAGALSSIGSMERGAARMRRLIDDMLTLARFGDPNTSFNPEAVDLREVVGEVLDLLAVSIERGSLQVVVDAPEGPVLALGEPAGLDCLLSNLISNAVKYTPPGGSVTIRLTPQRRRVEVTVADTGMGISEADQQKLFTEFFRSTNPDAVKLPGTGLGLSIAKSIVERHGGRIAVDSVLGKGTTFTTNLMSAPSPS